MQTNCILSAPSLIHLCV